MLDKENSSVVEVFSLVKFVFGIEVSSFHLLLLVRAWCGLPETWYYEWRLMGYRRGQDISLAMDIFPLITESMIS